MRHIARRWRLKPSRGPLKASVEWFHAQAYAGFLSLSADPPVEVVVLFRDRAAYTDSDFSATSVLLRVWLDEVTAPPSAD